MDDSVKTTSVIVNETASATICTTSLAILDSQSLFHGQREIWIEHEGERYRLRITRRGKLILQK